MQNRKFFTSLTAVFALTAGLASCSNNYEELNLQNADDRTPITLTSNVATRAASQDLQNTQIENGVKVGVFVTQDGAPDSDINNHLLTADGNGGFTGSTMYFPESATSVNIYAYAPYNSDWNDKLNVDNIFTVPTDQSKDADYCEADLMIADKISTAPTSQTINLTFKHKLSKLNLDFDLQDSKIDLEGATISILNVLPQVSVNVSTGEVGKASGDPTTITAAKFAAETTTFKASAVFAPQTIPNNTNFVQVVTADEKTFTAPLNQTVEFKSGKKYTYTVKFTASEGGEGGETTTNIELVPGSIVTDWEDGMLEQYEIGDYVTKGGQIIKPNAIADDNKDNIVAVIFSKEVSTTDAAAGYNAYAMRLLKPVDSKRWGSTKELVGEGFSSFADALADLDGRTKTDVVLASEYYTAASGGTVFEYCARAENLSPVGTLGSNWFVPSIGQVIQILNNLGGANINTSTSVSEKNTGSPIYYITESTVLENINQYVSPVTGMTFLEKGAATATYVTVSELDANNCWCFQTNPAVSNVIGNYAWGFGKNASKDGVNRFLIPCVALKLSASTAIIKAQ